MEVAEEIARNITAVFNIFSSFPIGLNDELIELRFGLRFGLILENDSEFSNDSSVLINFDILLL